MRRDLHVSLYGDDHISFSSQLTSYLGRYDFQRCMVNYEEVFASAEVDMDICETHERTHQGLVHDSAFGAFQLILASLLRQADGPDADTFRDVLSRTVSASFFVQEGTAVYIDIADILARPGGQQRTRHYFDRLPPEYRRAYQRYLHVFPNMVGRDAPRDKDRAVVRLLRSLGNAAMSNAAITAFASMNALTSFSLDEFLKEESPDRRQLRILDAMAESDSLDRMLAKTASIETRVLGSEPIDPKNIQATRERYRLFRQEMLSMIAAETGVAICGTAQETLVRAAEDLLENWDATLENAGKKYRTGIRLASQRDVPEDKWRENISSVGFTPSSVWALIAPFPVVTLQSLPVAIERARNAGLSVAAYLLPNFTGKAIPYGSDSAVVEPNDLVLNCFTWALSKTDDGTPAVKTASALNFGLIARGAGERKAAVSSLTEAGVCWCYEATIADEIRANLSIEPTSLPGKKYVFSFGFTADGAEDALTRLRDDEGVAGLGSLALPTGLHILVIHGSDSCYCAPASAIQIGLLMDAHENSAQVTISRAPPELLDRFPALLPLVAVRFDRPEVRQGGG